MMEYQPLDFLKWQAQVSIECMSSFAKLLQKMVAGNWFYRPSNALNLRNFNEGASMFAKMMTHYSESANRYWYQVIYPDGRRENFMLEADAEAERDYFNNTAKANLKIGGYAE